MKIGNFDLDVVEDECTITELKCNGKIIRSLGPFLTIKEAFGTGIKDCEKLFQDALKQLQEAKPKYQTKPKPIDAVQWFGDWVIGIRITSSGCEYYGQVIKPRDWIVDEKVVTNEEFEQDYEVIT